MITNILDANKEIERLTQALADSDSKLAASAAAQVDPALVEKAAKLEADNAALATKVVDLEKASKELADSIPAKVEAEASKKALEIVAAQGASPVGPASSTANAADIAAQLSTIENPVQRAEFFKKNRKALVAVRKNK